MPSLIIVTGPPCSGKTTLARAIARAVPCPAISRDEIKEGLGPGEGPPVPGDAATRHATAVFFETVELLMQRGVTLVAEAAFQHKLWASRLDTWSDQATIRIVRCVADGATIRERLLRRIEEEPQRKVLHADVSLIERIERGEVTLDRYRPVEVELQTLDVDTRDGYQPGLEEIISFVTG